jgi:hypothetical protein
MLALTASDPSNQPLAIELESNPACDGTVSLGSLSEKTTK